MTDKTEKQINDLAEFAEPIQRFLLENYHPHSAVVITLDDVKVIETSLGIPLSYGQKPKMTPVEIIESTVAKALEKTR